MHRIILFLLFIAIFTHCNQLKKQEITGLWQLEEVRVDVIPVAFNPTFLNLEEGNHFAVAKTSGDIIGIFALRSDRLTLKSEDEDWFNKSWNTELIRDQLILTGKNRNQLNTELIFKRTSEIPDFQEFENRVIGKWRILKIRKEGRVERLSNTWLEIGKHKYAIITDSGMVEGGLAQVNTRHRKIYFENESTAWRAWFYGDELRLTNHELNIQYDLERPELHN